MAESGFVAFSPAAISKSYRFAAEHKGFFGSLARHSGQNNFRDEFIRFGEESAYRVFLDEDDRAFFPKLRVQVGKRACLARASRAHVLRVEIQDDLLAAVIDQVVDLPILVRQRKPRTMRDAMRPRRENPGRQASFKETERFAIGLRKVRAVSLHHANSRQTNEEATMWTRKELKDKAKIAFKANYWKTVLVGLLLAVVIGGFGSFGSVPNAATDVSHVGDTPSSVHISANGQDGDDVDIVINDFDEKLSFDDGEGTQIEINGAPAAVTGLGAIVASSIFFLAFLVILAVVLAFTAFVLNPLEVGAQRFMLRNLNQPAEVKEVPYAFDTNYRETVKGMFIRDMCILGWSLLFIIPGIVKSYEYRMMPYLYADDPTMTKERAFAESKQMMTGQKWNAFVLDLSFIGWNILSALTLGILAIFYVNPYQGQTNAALYEKLRYGLPAPAPVAATPQGFAPGACSPYGQQAYATGSQPPVPPFAAAGAPAPVWDDEAKAPEAEAASEPEATSEPDPATESATEPMPASEPEAATEPTSAAHDDPVAPDSTEA